MSRQVGWVSWVMMMMMMVLFLRVVPLKAMRGVNRKDGVVRSHQHEPQSDDPFAYWTRGRIRSATPRDRYLDREGQSYTQMDHGCIVLDGTTECLRPSSSHNHQHHHYHYHYHRRHSRRNLRRGARHNYHLRHEKSQFLQELPFSSQAQEIYYSHRLLQMLPDDDDFFANNDDDDVVETEKKNVTENTNKPDKVPHKPSKETVTTPDHTPANISDLFPLPDSVISNNVIEFDAHVMDVDGVASVSFQLETPYSSIFTFAAELKDECGMNDILCVNNPSYGKRIAGFLDQTGIWHYTVVVQDGTGHKYRMGPVRFEVTEPEELESRHTWDYGGRVQTAVGRLLYTQLTEDGQEQAFLCSGAVVQDNDTLGRSLILTAAHCMYNDTTNEFSRRAMFIPNQVHTNGTRTDADCSNDPLGCWNINAALVHDNYVSEDFPENRPWDYAFLVVADRQGHTAGFGTSTGILDKDAMALPVSFDNFTPGENGVYDIAYSIGYERGTDPDLRYCAETVSEINGPHNFWLSKCDLGDGSSGGPWLSPSTPRSGDGTIVSVAAWAWFDPETNEPLPGRAGSRLSTQQGSHAECLFEYAKTIPLQAETSLVTGTAITTKECNKIFLMSRQ